MSRSRLSLFNYDLLRELCDHCRKERFHFVPIGESASPAACKRCGKDTTEIVDLSDTAVMRLVMQPNGEMVVVQVKTA